MGCEDDGQCLGKATPKQNGEKKYRSYLPGQINCHVAEEGVLSCEYGYGFGDVLIGFAQPKRRMG